MTARLTSLHRGAAATALWICSLPAFAGFAWAMFESGWGAVGVLLIWMPLLSLSGTILSPVLYFGMAPAASRTRKHLFKVFGLSLAANAALTFVLGGIAAQFTGGGC